MDDSRIVEDAAEVGKGITFNFRQPDGTILQERGGQVLAESDKTK